MTRMGRGRVKSGGGIPRSIAPPPKIDMNEEAPRPCSSVPLVIFVGQPFRIPGTSAPPIECVERIPMMFGSGRHPRRPLGKVLIYRHHP